jgi:hypothetical protein
LPQLHRASLEHDEGAFYFDQQIRFAAFTLAEDLGFLLEGYGLRDGTSARAQAALALSIPAEAWETCARCRNQPRRPLRAQQARPRERRANDKPMFKPLRTG